MRLGISELQKASLSAEPWILVTITETRGSTPREVGAAMLVRATDTLGTIGGGELEFQATASARELLSKPADVQYEHYILGARLGQCCGGQASLWFESCAHWRQPLQSLDANQAYLSVTREHDTARTFVCAEAMAAMGLPENVVLHADKLLKDSNPHSQWITAGEDRYFLQPFLPNDFQVWLFGAGHVGQRVATVLSTLPCEVTWIDERSELLDMVTADNIHKRTTRSPSLLVDVAPPGGYFVVMTHSHALDADICQRILMRNDFAYAGLIGSRAKRASFTKRFSKQGLSEQTISQLVCPLGGVTYTGGYDKDPGVIAIGLAQQLLATRHKVRNL